MIDDEGYFEPSDFQLGSISQLSDKPCRTKKPEFPIGFHLPVRADQGRKKAPKRKNLPSGKTRKESK